MRPSIAICLVFMLIAASSAAEPIYYKSGRHQVSAQIPTGWDQVQGVREKTILKLVRTGINSQQARIVLVIDNIPVGRIAEGFNIWSMSDMEIRKSIEGDSFLGEAVTGLGYGRGAIDDFHFVWTKT